MQCNCSPQSQAVLFGVLAQTHILNNIMKTYMHSLLFMLLQFSPCSKTDNARATNEVLKGCHGIINGLKLNKKSATKDKCSQCDILFFRSPQKVHVCGAIRSLYILYSWVEPTFGCPRRESEVSGTLRECLWVSSACVREAAWFRSDWVISVSFSI